MGSLMTKKQFKKSRESLGLSASQLSKLLGCSERHIHNIESGDREIKQRFYIGIYTLLFIKKFGFFKEYCENLNKGAQ
jgi:transcriptional regulator with XRE-family HTH domain